MEKLLTIREASKKLNVTTKTIRNWIKQGRLPAYKTVGNHYRFDPKELEDWLAEQKA